MESKNLKNSENAADIILRKISEKKNENSENEKKVKQEEIKVDSKEDTIVDVKEEIKVDSEEETKLDVKEEIKTDSEEKTKLDVKEEIKVDSKDETKLDVKEEIKVGSKDETKLDVKEEIKVDDKEIIKVDLKDETKIEVIEERKKNSKEESEKKQKEKTPPIDYNKYSKKELLDLLNAELDKPVYEIKKAADNIKNIFYKKHIAEISEIKNKFIEDGGKDDDFKPEKDAIEEEFRKSFDIFKQKKNEYNIQKEKEKKENLQKKLQIIEQIENLINTSEKLNTTYDDFTKLQNQWNSLGGVPAEDAKTLWEKYHIARTKFYDYVKINKELRDLDLKKNLEKKIVLCEKAEDLILEPNIIKAFSSLQALHYKWKEIGPASRENREELWQRFKNITTKINVKHHNFFEEQKKEQENNLKAKRIICEKAEEISKIEITQHQDWKTQTKEIIELQKLWRKIGYAPKKFNTEIYQKFRTACDSFFDAKREFYSTINQEQNDNLQKKIILCEQVEKFKESTDWRKSSEIIINIQKEWKLIGHVPKKEYLTIRDRFNNACNQFFNSKREHFANRTKQEVDNLKLKQELIEKVNNILPTENDEDNLKQLQTYQKEWTQIGFVPIKEKDKIYKTFKDAIEQKFNQFNLDNTKRNEIQFKNKLQDIVKSPRAKKNIELEIEKLQNKAATLKDDINLWENNLGFFAKSKNAESMIADFTKKIDIAKEELKQTQDKITMYEKVDKKVNS